MYYSVGDIMEYIVNVTKAVSRPHKHKKYEIIVYLNCYGTLYADNEEINITPGKIVIVPPGTEHYYLTDKEDDFNRIYISGDFEHIFNFTSAVELSDNKKGEGITLAKMIYNNRFANREYITSLINAFAHFLLSISKIEDEISLEIKKIVNEISNNFSKCDICLNSLLKNSGYAEDYIRAEFKKVTGNTPNEFLTKARISHACYLIDMYKKSVPLNVISEQCGYTDYIYFSRKFKEIMGVSPRKYMQDNA